MFVVFCTVILYVSLLSLLIVSHSLSFLVSATCLLFSPIFYVVFSVSIISRVSCLMSASYGVIFPVSLLGFLLVSSSSGKTCLVFLQSYFVCVSSVSSSCDSYSLLSLSITYLLFSAIFCVGCFLFRWLLFGLFLPLLVGIVFSSILCMQHVSCCV